MEVKAVAKYVGISPQKLGLVAEVARGKKVDEALARLKFFPTPGAKVLAKVIKSAAANAENNFQMPPSEPRGYLKKDAPPSSGASKPHSQAFKSYYCHCRYGGVIGTEGSSYRF
jgi:hypothetical protein